MQVHPGQISPGQTFDLFYLLRNPVDSTTYYVRAVVYDLRSGDVLATQNLSQSTNNTHLFTATLQAPADSVGYGRSIVSIASVYTDASYTTKSDGYEEEEQYFLIKEDRSFGGGGMDYKSLERLIDKAIGSRLDNLPKPEPAQPVNLDAVFGAIGALQREVNRIPKDDPETVDLTPLRTKLDGLEALVRTIPTDLPEAIDLSPVTEAIASVQSDIEMLRQAVESAEADTVRAVQELLNAHSANVLAQIETGLKDMMSRQNFTMPLEELIKLSKEQLTVPVSALFKTAPKAAQQLPDVSHLMR